MPALEGFKAWIEVNGYTVREYGIDALDDETGVSCWIPCEIGKVRSRGASQHSVRIDSNIILCCRSSRYA